MGNDSRGLLMGYETSVAYTIQSAGRALILKVRADVTADDFITVLTIAKRDPAYLPETTLIVDASQATGPQIDGDAVRRLARFAQGDTARIGQRIALIPRPVPVSYGLSRMYQMLGESQRHIQIFETLEAALAWADSSGAPDEGSATKEVQA